MFKQWFWETGSFRLLPKTRDFDENGEKDKFAFYTQKQDFGPQNPETTKWQVSLRQAMVYRKWGFHNPDVIEDFLGTVFHKNEGK